MILNSVNKKMYIGQTVQDLDRRWALHKHQSMHRNRPLYRSMRKYGVNKFTIHILECPPLSCSQEHLNERERYWIKKLNTLAPHGYNLTTGGDGKFYLAEETKIRISQSKLGKPRSDATKEACRLGSLGNTNKRGKKVSDEGRQRISEAGKGRKASEYTKNRMRDAHSGANAYNSRKVVCIETGEIFNSSGEAARALNLIQSSISAVCLGKRKTTGGLTFKFAA